MDRLLFYQVVFSRISCLGFEEILAGNRLVVVDAADGVGEEFRDGEDCCLRVLLVVGD